MQFELTKATEALKFELSKREVDSILPCQVKLAFDVSGSFDDEHRNGYTQQLLNRFVPFAMLFDKDKTLDSYVFSNSEERLCDINEHNYSNYVRKEIMQSDSYNGGTNYLPVIKHMIEGDALGNVKEKAKGFFGKLFGKSQESVVESSKSSDKNLIFFVTDGQASDQEETKRFLDYVMPDGKNFIVFISIGSHKFSFFDRNYSDTEYSSYFNLTPRELRNLEDCSDEDMYNLILTPQLIEWMK